MKAAQISTYGNPSVMEINEAEKPTITNGKVLIEVHASSLNPFDTMVRSGYLQESTPLDLPATLGGDIAGIVTEVASDVTNFKVGDKVFGQASIVAGNSGAFAEFAVTSANQIGIMPQNLDFIQAASLPLTGVSAIQAITQHIKLQSGQKIFIHGGGGNIGSIAIQLAKKIGAQIATTATGNDIELVKQLGASEVINYKVEDFTNILKNYDAVFDTVGGDDFTKALSVLRSGGIAVSMIAQADEATAREKSVTAITQHTHVTTDALNELRNQIEAGVITPRIGQTFPLDEIQQAFTARESGHISGKIALKIR